MSTGFDAGTAVEALAYDFTTLKRSDGTPFEGKGVTPEPTMEQLNTLIARVRAAVTRTGVDPASLASASPAQVAEAFRGADDDALAHVKDEMLDAFGELCQGSPTRDQVAALPYRVQQAWMTWMLRELTDPTRSNGGSAPSPATATNGAFST